ncbi:hypothetical protein BS78_02G277700 [Paspalum vaginatum]|nr:hypothetical protein BS78_02G277700 [Paspalum vaginatum]
MEKRGESKERRDGKMANQRSQLKKSTVRWLAWRASRTHLARPPAPDSRWSPATPNSNQTNPMSLERLPESHNLVTVRHRSSQFTACRSTRETPPLARPGGSPSSLPGLRLSGVQPG